VEADGTTHTRMRCRAHHQLQVLLVHGPTWNRHKYSPCPDANAVACNIAAGCVHEWAQRLKVALCSTVKKKDGRQKVLQNIIWNNMGCLELQKRKTPHTMLLMFAAGPRGLSVAETGLALHRRHGLHG